MNPVIVKQNNQWRFTWIGQGQLKTHRSHDHMQRHRNIQIECIVIENLYDKEHGNHIHIAQIADFHGFRAAFRSEKETFDSNKCKLKKRHQISRPRIQSVDDKIKIKISDDFKVAQKFPLTLFKTSAITTIDKFKLSKKYSEISTRLRQLRKNR